MVQSRLLDLVRDVTGETGEIKSTVG